ncbi:MAG TPA: nickel-dependent hydrogenase large subunit [Acetobacteraceae bacterium]|nr:nickel-dependent hydrogenase large subunit [Acetobacteraceae bacterium]
MSDNIPPRQVLTRDVWAQMAANPDPPLVALWADTRVVYALLRQDDRVLLVSTTVEDDGYPALSPMRPFAACFERVVRDLWGHAAIGGTDQRARLDHGRWAQSAPMAVRPGPPASAEPPEFAMPEELDQIPLGPVRGGIEPAAHLRLGVRGQAVERLELRLGYAHKGVLALMRGKSPRAAARFAARLAGETTVAHSLAFARATEAALACQVPPRAEALRQVMAQVEQIVWRLDLASAMAEADGRPSSLTARGAEALRGAANVAFGHRLMMDCVIPGGVATDIAPGGAEAIERALHQLVGPEIDVRTLRDTLRTLPDGSIAVPLPVSSGEGLGHAVGPTGDVWHWLCLDHGQIASVFMCDPGWAQWARLQTTMAGDLLDHLPHTLASLGLSSSGVDL